MIEIVGVKFFGGNKKASYGTARFLIQRVYQDILHDVLCTCCDKIQLNVSCIKLYFQTHVDQRPD